VKTAAVVVCFAVAGFAVGFFLVDCVVYGPFYGTLAIFVAIPFGTAVGAAIGFLVARGRWG
jgi:hypothetical protein